MEELGDDLTKVERELSKLQASLNESKRKNARDSGYPEGRRTTLDDELDEERVLDLKLLGRPPYLLKCFKIESLRAV